MRYYPAPEEVIEMPALIEAVRSAFRDHGDGRCQMPAKSYVTLPGGDFRTMPSYLPALNTAGVKIVNVHPENQVHGLPTVMAMIILLDPPTGKPIAVMNASALTDLRTGASAAVATEALAAGTTGVLGVIGAGRQAISGIRAISESYAIQSVSIWSRRESTAEKLLNIFPDLDIRITGLQKAADADVLLTTTPSRSPLILSDWVADGTHINAIGADAPGKQELDPRLVLRSRVFVDDREQATHSGEINVPVQQGLFSPDDIAGTLGEVIIGKNGRWKKEEITIFDSTGIAITDLAAAFLALENGRYLDLPFDP